MIEPIARQYRNPQGSLRRPGRGRHWRAAGFLLLALLGGPPSALAEYTDADAQAAQRLVKKRCAKCHGADGLGISDKFASLAGQPAEYLLKQIFNFKTGQRRDAKMQRVVESLSAQDAYIASEYFARLPAGFTPSDDPAAIAAGRRIYFEGNRETGVHNCASCHGVYATGGGPVARLAGQNPTYLETQIRSFIANSRNNDRAMHAIVAPLSPQEIHSVAAYLAAEN